MELAELKLISASNIIKLRTAAGMTQAELGAKLNYSDKTISKWERGEAIPDAFVLTELAEIFGVTVDYILSSHDTWRELQDESVEEQSAQVSYSVDMIIGLTIVSVWTTALVVFVALWLSGIIFWKTFLITLPISLLVYMVLICVFKRTKYLQYVIAAFVLSILVLLYFILPLTRLWQIFLIAVPALVIVFMSCNIRIKPGSRLKFESKKR